MRTMDRIIAWLLIAFGLTHLALTGKAYPHLGINAIWFASGGLLMMTVAALNLLRVAYGSIAGACMQYRSSPILCCCS